MTTEARKFGAFNKTITIATSHGYKIIVVEEILYCQADSNYSIIYLPERKVVASKPLKFIEHKINSTVFMRVNQSYLVNTNYVREIVTKEDSCLFLLNGTRIPISRKYKKAVEEFFVTK